MVGGFGQNPYLREMIKRVVGPKIAVIQPANASTAVVRGALTTPLALTTPKSSRIEVLSRVARKCYGIRCGAFRLTTRKTYGLEGSFNYFLSNIKLLIGRRYWSPFHGKYFIRAVDCLVKEVKYTEGMMMTKDLLTSQRAIQQRSQSPRSYCFCGDGV
jgi:hypothetical protein